MNVLRKGPKYRSTDRDSDLVEAKKGLPQMKLQRRGPNILINRSRFQFRERQERATPNERTNKKSPRGIVGFWGGFYGEGERGGGV